jgi:hypothetical protein
MMDIAVRWQTGLTIAFFIILAAALAAVGLMASFLRRPSVDL